MEIHLCGTNRDPVHFFPLHVSTLTHTQPIDTTSTDSQTLYRQRMASSPLPPSSIFLPLPPTIPMPIFPSYKRTTTTKTQPMSTTSIIRSSKPSKIQVSSTSMPLARLTLSLSTNSLLLIPQNPHFLSHFLPSHPSKFLVSIAPSRTMLSLVPSIPSSVAGQGPGSYLPSEEAASSNINPLINTPPMTLWEEAPQLISNAARIGPIPPPLLSTNPVGPTRSGTFSLTVLSASSTPHVLSFPPPIFILTPLRRQPPFPKTDSYQPNPKFLVFPGAPFLTTLFLSSFLSYRLALQVPLAVLLGNPSCLRFFSLPILTVGAVSGSIASCNHKCISLHDCIIQRPSLL